MIITRTPFRISFFGGGTDYPHWFRQHGGQVLATAIDRYCYLFCRWLPPFFDHRHRVVYSQIENVSQLSEVSHPAARGVLQYLEVGAEGADRGVSIHHEGDLPARSGLGSSSSYTVGLLHAIHALRGQLMSKEELASQAIHVEQDVLCETVGCQDQILAAHGGFNQVIFHPDDSYEVRPLVIAPERRQRLIDHLLLVFTGISRISSDVAGSYVPALTEKEAQLKRMMALVDQAIDVLRGSGPLLPFGELLHDAWQIKRGLGVKVSNPQIDQIYSDARAAGAIGGKVLGAGGGGFMLFFAPPAAHPEILARIGGRVHVPFGIDSEGSRVVYYKPGTRALTSPASA